MPKSTEAIHAKIQQLVDELDNLKTGYRNDILLLTENFQEHHSQLTGELHRHYQMLEEEIKKKEETMILELYAHYEAQLQQKLEEAEEHHKQQMQEKDTTVTLYKQQMQERENTVTLHKQVMLLKKEKENLELLLKQKETDLETEDELPEAERERQRSRRKSFRLLKAGLEHDDGTGFPESPLDPALAAAFPNYKLLADCCQDYPTLTSSSSQPTILSSH
mmetsp:Transcript_28751/g.69667  ORF Transcript_28751/g.69667 Transcript_28751/m.69667 type:complete len:220 (-) Transcript_28751:211-870(-)|eukprot:CAMPEP_0113518102 /NCGR_PEP_ID=MMETSP0014_2-20120614/42674_1 /TAXON_ID=2857 /ORGANISM="Nitzschia sp." /LENGTH=219 /DNA_ID=CAMNT_0000415465 /DNA_START=621 /DNA_END=1280 /DNA_ORIENTATION=- /assembly_acc=CAM_ASM_000159